MSKAQTFTIKYAQKSKTCLCCLIIFRRLTLFWCYPNSNLLTMALTKGSPACGRRLVGSCPALPLPLCDFGSAVYTPAH